jgi:hypothetical protein
MIHRRMAMLCALLPAVALAQKPQQPQQRGGDLRQFFLVRWTGIEPVMGAPLRFDVTLASDGGFLNNMTFASGSVISMTGRWSAAPSATLNLQIQDWQPRATYNTVTRQMVPVQYPSTAAYQFQVLNQNQFQTRGSEGGSFVWNRAG